MPEPTVPDYVTQARQEAIAQQVDPDLVHRLITQESGYDPAARSSQGAIGLMQLMPSTAKDLGVDATDPVQNLKGGIHYLKTLLTKYDGNPRLAVAAYNAGPGAVDTHGGVPPYAETQKYVTAVAGTPTRGEDVSDLVPSSQRPPAQPPTGSAASAGAATSPDSPPDYGYGPRWDEATQSYAGPPKGLGFLGPLIRPDSPKDAPMVMSEYSIDRTIDGQNVSLPTFVPTLTKSEVQTLLSLKDGDPIPAPIEDKAIAFAKTRLAAGKSPFAGEGEQQALYPDLQRAPIPDRRPTDTTTRAGGSIPNSGDDVTALVQAAGPDFTVTNEKDAEGNATVDPNPGAAPGSGLGTMASAFASGAGEYLNPVTIGKGLIQATNHPIETVKGIGAAQGELFNKAKASYQQGEYSTAARHLVDYLIPFLGPGLDEAADSAQRGDLAKSAGQAVGFGLSMFGPDAVAQSGAGAALAAKVRGVNQAVKDAVAFGRDNAIPVDAATATQNRAVAAAQHLADRTVGGSMVASRANQATAEALANTGERLAGQIAPGAATAESAGASVRGGVEQSIRDLSTSAEQRYATAERLAAQKRTTVQTGTKTVDTGVLDAQGKPITRSVPTMATFETPVDFAAFKQAAKPLYDRLAREAQLVPLQGAKARALTALDRVMKGPDTVSLMTAERASSDLGALAGSPDLPELRTSGQGSAAYAFGRLRQQVDRAAATAGPDVAKALREGRALTKAKYAAADILDGLHDEPARTTGRLTAPKDTAIEQLRDIRRIAPTAVPQIGRSVIDGMLQHATEGGGFDNAGRLYAQWQNLGLQTKGILFGKTTADLDKFFLLAKKLAENPNPSGTAHVLAMGAQAAQAWSNPLSAIATQVGGASVSALLRNPTTVQLLNKALSLELGKAPAQVRAAAWAAVKQGTRVNAALNPSRTSPAVTGATP